MRKTVNRHLILHYVSQRKCQIDLKTRCFLNVAAGTVIIDIKSKNEKPATENKAGT